MANTEFLASQFAQRQRAAALALDACAKLLAMARDGRGATLPVLALTTLCLFLRKPHAFLNPQLWAEDGKIFFLQQWDQGAAAMMVPYAGYLHFVPRLFAAIGDRFVSLGQIPLFYNLAALGCTLFAVWFILRSRLEVQYKPLIALAMVLVPHGFEVFVNLANVQWILAPLLVVLALQDNPQTRFSACIDVCVLVAVGLTGPFVLLLLPILLLRPLLFGVTRFNGFFTGLVLALAVVQLSCLWGSDRLAKSAAEPRHYGAIGRMVIERFAPHLFLGEQLPIAAGVPLLMAVVAAGVYLWIGSTSRLRRIEAMLLAATVLCLASMIAVADAPHLFHVFANGQRYFYIPYVLIAWFFLLGLGSPQPGVRGLAAIFSGLIAFAGIAHLQADRPPDLHWPKYAQTVMDGKTTTIPVNPDESWSIVVRPHTTATYP